MKTSVQGAIRRAPNAISWVFSLGAMRAAGLQHDLVIKTWRLDFDSSSKIFCQSQLLSPMSGVQHAGNYSDFVVKKIFLLTLWNS